MLPLNQGNLLLGPPTCPKSPDIFRTSGARHSISVWWFPLTHINRWSSSLGRGGNKKKQLPSIKLIRGDDPNISKSSIYRPLSIKFLIFQQKTMTWPSACHWTLHAWRSEGFRSRTRFSRFRFRSLRAVPSQQGQMLDQLFVRGTLFSNLL